ncbi:DUF302 domain-containing protein [Membranicola marinus]|uniref:DUF302 domain-containing protein n=1 Tax=Membranihabitans marinus TaxID=1227546 RepID=A0A953HXI8_9BACT|nr:DUF302 domain-containing protein [Membranihabitans marinus]MBY5959976.1 DUF302 domain-containing protein [Membranihabitans marinus]
MKYYMSKIVGGNFDKVIAKVTEELKKEGFGVLTEIDIKGTLKKKLDVDFRNYKILGACNPEYAYNALQSEDKVGTMLPCNVIVQETTEGDIEVAAVNPQASMMAIENEKLKDLAGDVNQKLQRVIDAV